METSDITAVLVALPGIVAALVAACALGYLTRLGGPGNETKFWVLGFLFLALGTAMASMIGFSTHAVYGSQKMHATGDLATVVGLVLLTFGLLEHLGRAISPNERAAAFLLVAGFLTAIWVLPQMAYWGAWLAHAVAVLTPLGTAVFCVIQRRRFLDRGLRFVALAFLLVAMNAVTWNWHGETALWRMAEVGLSVTSIVCLAMGFGLIFLRSQELLAEETTKALNFTEERFRLALQGANDGVWDWDLTTNQVLLTDRVMQIMSEPRGDRIFTSEQVLSFIHPEDLEHYKSAVRDIFKGRADTLSVEYRVRYSKDGQTGWAQTRGVAVRKPGTGLITRMAGTVSDITERKLFERELIKAKEEAELSSRSKTEFLAHMSHELRTPLNAIIGFSDIMKQEVFGPVGNDRYVDYNATVNMAGRHLMQIVSDIIDLGKIEAGQTRLDDTLCDLEEIAEACIQLVAARARDEKLTLVKEIDPTIPWLRGDTIRIKQIVLNLITNSIKFTQAGGRVVLAIDRTENAEMRIRVSDSGIGIARKDIPRALSRFGRLGSPYTRDVDGMGLGLTLVQTFAGLHGAHFRLDSEEGKGTTVVIVFPAERSVERQGTEVSATASRAGRSAVAQ